MSIIDRDIENTDAPVILFSSISTWTPSSNDVRSSSKGMAAPQPPPRNQSCVRPNVAPPPPPPVPPTRNSSVSFASRYQALFEPLSRLPGPEPFTNCQKLYPSQQTNRVQRSRRSRPAPKPPTSNGDAQTPLKDGQIALPNKDESKLIDLSDPNRTNLTNFVDESLSKLTLENETNMVNHTQMASSCIDCPTCNQIGQPLNPETECQQFPVSCLPSNGLDPTINASYESAIHQEPSDTIATLQQSTPSYLSNNNVVSNNITTPPYNYQYHATRAPYAYSATSSYLQSISNQPLFYGQNNYQQQPPVNYNEYFWGPN